MLKLMVAQFIGQDYMENIKSQCFEHSQRRFEASTAARWRSQELGSSHPRSRSTSPQSPFNPRRTPPREPSIIHKGLFTFTMENNETRVSTTALASSVQSPFEALCLVGKVFGVPVPGTAIRNRLKSYLKDL
ncbi:hypothetical protein L3X38_009893 [Prunus dulcis]|uniref:Uncharacterized protein n=1 Tax=Prunus dulcis TaxID=3755 RepID=A0AAD4WEI3_PRUDU|nr:hypothetical protein L3X38_009893 [Prunus dulcis]